MGRVHQFAVVVCFDWWMADRVRVRRLNDVEGRQLQQIVRRGGKSDRSIVKWRRAMVVLASAGGNDVVAIARLVQTSPDRVREMIHRFNDLGTLRRAPPARSESVTGLISSGESRRRQTRVLAGQVPHGSR